MSQQSSILMNKNTPILEVAVEGNSIVGTGSVLNEKMLPIQLQDGFTLKDVQAWFSKRQIPEKREGLKEARILFRGFEKNSGFFSLTDQYWVKHNKNDTWNKGNFFHNHYTSSVGAAFFEPWAVDKKEIMEPSPDRTTNGVLRKCWQQGEDGISYLLKAGSIKFRQEPLSEVLASYTLKSLGLLPFVEYELVIHGLRFCAKSRNFVTDSTEFVPAAAIYNKAEKPENKSIYSHLLHMCQQYNIFNAKDYIDKMIVCDYVLCNSDRHLGNFGFIRSAENGMILSFAPLFDNGSAYWGNSEDVNSVKSRLFSDVEADILKKAKEKGQLRNARSTQAMKELINSYPEIDEKKKKDIIQSVEKIDLEITMSEKEEKKPRYDMEIIM